jgi:hypothetical protein
MRGRAGLACPTAVLSVCLAFCLSGCGGGGGNNVSVSAGQGPDPVVLDVPVAYVKKPLPLDGQGNVIPSDVRRLLTFDVGADLYVRDRASPSADARNVTAAETLGLGDVRDLESSYDGNLILFAMRAPFMEGVADEDQPTWNIWEYDIPGDALRRIVASDITAESGHDLAPHYLPDGRIVFSSTRQRQSSAVLLDEGKPQFAALEEDRNEPAFVLHVMNADGSDIRQISFNQSHDLDAVVLESGKIAFSRWDNAGTRNAVHLYTVNPDGTELELLYGAESHDWGSATVQFLQPRQMPDGRLSALLRPFVASDLGGDLVAIDTPAYLENTQPTQADQGVLFGPAQVALTANDVRFNEISPGGKFSAAYPLHDGTNRMLVSWTDCRLLENTAIVPCTSDRLADPAAVPAPPLYGIWMYDAATNTQLPVLAPEEGFIFSDIVAAENRSLPTVIFDKAASGEFDPALVAAGAGLLNIRSVYDIDGIDTATPDIPTLADPGQTLADQRPARFLRIVKAVSIPDDDVRDIAGTAFGHGAAQGMREIIGYVPVEPDGSVVVKVPANVPLALSVLDSLGRRITDRHQSWLQLRPGEELACNGCHDAGSGLSHGRADAFASAYPGATTTAQPFPNTDPAIFADFGETMAEARARLSCATDCAAIMPKVDVGFDDVWTDAAIRPKDASFAYLYGDLSTLPPVAQSCIDSWTTLCRIVINYEAHIHPLWNLSREVFANDGVTVIADRTCTTCHGPLDDLGMAQVPEAQLDLTDGASDRPGHADHFKSYEELLAGDFEQELGLNDVLQDILDIVGTDPVTGDPITQPRPVARSMSTAGANASPAFFFRFDVTGSHAGDLTPAELRLIAEWLDVGAQYFNNPFDAPVN